MRLTCCILMEQYNRPPPLQILLNDRQMAVPSVRKPQAKYHCSSHKCLSQPNAPTLIGLFFSNFRLTNVNVNLELNVNKIKILQEYRK